MQLRLNPLWLIPLWLKGLFFICSLIFHKFGSHMIFIQSWTKLLYIWPKTQSNFTVTHGHRLITFWSSFLSIFYPDISDDGLTLTFTPPLQYNHISLVQTIDGVTLATRAEVGLLTRNVVVRGSVQTEWVEEILACVDEFDTSKWNGHYHSVDMNTPLSLVNCLFNKFLYYSIKVSTEYTKFRITRLLKKI